MDTPRTQADFKYVTDILERLNALNGYNFFPDDTVFNVCDDEGGPFGALRYKDSSYGAEHGWTYSTDIVED